MQIYNTVSFFSLCISFWKVVSLRKLLDYFIYLCWAKQKHLTMKKVSVINNNQACQTRIAGIKDTMEVLSGKWKFHILGTLMQGDKIRFMDLLREVEGIGTKMLSKELQDLEMNHLISRTVLNTKPVTVEYQITDFGKTLEPIIDEIAKWGIAYRNFVYNKNR